LASRFSLREFIVDEDGATAVEYGLIVACVFLAIIGGMSLFAGNANTMYTKIGTAVSGAVR
jgi:pilus assembly protein Flp/PilA